MVHIQLAGKASDPIFAQAEMLAYYMEKNLPDFNVTVTFKSDADWSGFVEKIYQKNIWHSRVARDRTIKSVQSLDQLIWYDSGELIGMFLTTTHIQNIGNAADFFKYSTDCYGLDKLTDDQELLCSIAAENVANGVHQMIQSN